MSEMHMKEQVLLSGINLQQTQKTVEEQVNCEPQALTDKPQQQRSFVLPEKNQDAVIQKMIINDINVVITPKVIEQQQPTIQYKEITLPPLTDELLMIQAENQSLLETIEQLKAYTHKSLAQANAAVKLAQEQFDAWKERRDLLWKNAMPETRQSMENAISNNPDCTEKDVNVQVDNMSYDQYFDFLEQFQCGKKCEQAKLELKRVEQERENKCSKAIKKCQQRLKDNNAHSKECERSFVDKVVMTILPDMPGYEDIDAPFPEAQLLDPLRQLCKYQLNCSANQIFSQTRDLWANNRPCIIVRREEEWKKRKENQERHEKSEKIFNILVNVLSWAGIFIAFALGIY